MIHIVILHKPLKEDVTTFFGIFHARVLCSHLNKNDNRIGSYGGVL